MTVREIESLNANLIYVSGIEMLRLLGRIKKKSSVKTFLRIADIPAKTRMMRSRLPVVALEKYVNILINKYVDYLVLTSPGYYDRYYKVRGFSDKEFYVFENVPEKRIFGRFDHLPEQLRNDKNLVVGYNSAMASIHVVPLKKLLEACKELRDIKILIAGKGPEFEVVKSEAERYDNVSILRAYDYEKGIVNLYSLVDVV